MKDLNKKKSRGVKPGSKAKPKNFKPGKAYEAFKKAMKALAVIVAAATIGAGGGYGVRLFADFLSHSQMFAIKSIEITGIRKLDRQEILSLAGMKEGQNIFRVKVDQAVQRIAKNPWVKGVTVRRQYPDRIIIRVVERQAESLVRRKGLWLMDREGLAFKPVGEGDPVDLPIISGGKNVDAPDDEEAVGKAMEIIALAKKSGQLPAEKISELVIEPGGTITLLTAGTLDRVDMGGGDPVGKWAILESVLADAKRSNVEIVRVNLNYPEGAAVTVKSVDPQTLVADGR